MSLSNRSKNAEQTSDGCPEREKILQLADGQVEQDQSESISSHIDHCETCRELFYEIITEKESKKKSAELEQTFSIQTDDVSLDETVDPSSSPSTKPSSHPSAHLSARPSANSVSKTSEFVATKIPEQIGSYRIERLVAEGGFGRVFKAQHMLLESSVAIKVPREDRFDSSKDIGKFVEEARTLARLKHPNIVAIHEIGLSDNELPFMVMDWIEGDSLGNYVESKQLTDEQICLIMSDVAGALNYAHQKGFFHRDLKPPNILVDEKGTPYVADFGLAFHEDSQDEHQGQFAGTVNYMAPEQVARDTRNIDGRTDIWALGVISYELLTKSKPFTGQSKLLTIENILKKNPRPLRQRTESISPPLEQVVLKCLEKDPRKRYAAAIDFQEDLLSASQSQKTRKKPWLLIGATVLSLLIFGAILAGINAMKPKPIPGAPGVVEELFWHDDEGSEIRLDDGVLRLTTDKRGAVLLGRLETNTFELSMDVKQPLWMGNFWIVTGFNDNRLIEIPSQIRDQYQVLNFVCFPELPLEKRYKWVRETITKNVALGRQGQVYLTNSRSFGDSEIPPPEFSDGQFKTITLRYTEGILTDLEFDGVPFPDSIGSKYEVPLFTESSFGIIVSHTSLRIKNLRIDGVQQRLSYSPELQMGR